jgi:hypothetical protein
VEKSGPSAFIASEFKCLILFAPSQGKRVQPLIPIFRFQYDFATGNAFQNAAGDFLREKKPP